VTGRGDGRDLLDLERISLASVNNCAAEKEVHVGGRSRKNVGFPGNNSGNLGFAAYTEKSG
jgi:hypothetical protein